MCISLIGIYSHCFCFISLHSLAYPAIHCHPSIHFSPSSSFVAMSRSFVYLRVTFPYCLIPDISVLYFCRDRLHGCFDVLTKSMSGTRRWNGCPRWIYTLPSTYAHVCSLLKEVRLYLPVSKNQNTCSPSTFLSSCQVELNMFPCQTSYVQCRLSAASNS